MIEVDETGAATARLAALGVAVLNFDAIGHETMEPAVVLGQRGVRRAREDAHGFLDRVVRQVRIEPLDRVAEAARQCHP